MQISDTQKRAVLVTGGAGFLGWHLVRRLERGNLRIVATLHRADTHFHTAHVRRVDLTLPESVESLLDATRPAAIVHTAAMTQTGECESRPDAAEHANIRATRNLVDFATRLAGSAPLPHFLFISTDLVFDGESPPYDESAPTSPILQYGKTKEQAEAAVRSYPGPWTILRPALMYGPPTPHRDSFIEWIRKPLADGTEVTLFTDEWRTPVLVDDVVESIARLLDKTVTGVFHCGGAQRLSRKEMGDLVAQRWALDASKIRPLRRNEAQLPCPRPRDVSLLSARLAAAIGLRPAPFAQGIQRIP